ncbi:universal stress protein [Streptomyces tendae]|uniref:universal stress protein n=1 Tax=Streptomyces tendae TaxID=1932 RepID=UPI0039A5723A
MVLGLQTDHPCEELIEFAFDAARRRGTGLLVVRAFRTAFRPAPVPSVPLVSAAPEGPAPVPWPRAQDGGLLVVGRRGLDHQVAVFTGPVTHAVLHHVGCPVAVVPHG